VVTTPLLGGPADKAGVRPGDVIVQVDGKETKGLTLDGARDVLRGEVGTSVVLTVRREGEKEPLEIPIVRAVILSETVTGDRRKPDRTWSFFLEGQDRIGYVRISDFGDRTADELERALRELLGEGMKGLVLDLRDNPGGLLIPAVRVCDLFISSGEIVTTRGRGGEVREAFRARGEGTLPDFPMAVLVNESSASASEIAAACLQDHHRAVIVGEHTYGKETVQEIIRLPSDYGALKVTVATYWRPSGKNISRPPNADEATKQGKAPPGGDWGVKPDEGYEVQLDKEQRTRLIRWLREHQLNRRSGAESKGKGAKAAKLELRTDVDPQLAKGVEYLRREVSPRPQAKPGLP